MATPRTTAISLVFLTFAGLAGAYYVRNVFGNVDELPTATVFRNRKVAQLVSAAESGNVALVRQLANAGVDVNARGRSGMTPLLRTLQIRNREGYCELLKLGADPNLLDNYGRSVMHEAATILEPEWLKAALEHGGNPNLLNKGARYFRNLTPIYGCTEFFQRPENLRLLIKAGADLNHRDSNGDFPLYVTTMGEGYETALILVESGADFRLKNSKGRDVLDNLRDRQSFDAVNKVRLEKLVSALNERGANLPSPRHRLLREPPGPPEKEPWYEIREADRLEKIHKRQAGG